MKQQLLVAAALAVLSACSPAALTTTFDPSAAAYVNQSGKNSVSGQAFLRRNDGMVVYAAGSEVSLIPITTYSQERFTSIYGVGKSAIWHPGFKTTDPAYEQYMRKTVANGEGRFKFEGVADGSYFVQTSVIWNVGGAQQGGAIMERVQLSNGQAVELIMTGQ